MTKLIPIVGLALFLAPVGCVNQQSYDDLAHTNRALEDRNVALQQELDSRTSTIGLLRERVGESDGAISSSQQRSAKLNSDLIQMREQFRQLTDRLNQAALGAIDPRLEIQLRAFAEANPRLIRYDDARGMVEFSSDLTFGSGSVDVRPEAKTILEQFATILKNSAASSYEIRIVGHTDNVPVSRPATRQKHPTNLHLSVHRAISVRNVLKSMGVAAERIEVAGWGELHPVVANPSKGGVAANRRVEIYLVPSSRDFAAAPSQSPAPVQTKRATAPDQDYPMK